MIVIVSSSARECSALLALCEVRGWPGVGCDSVRSFRKMLREITPKVVLTRQKLDDGYSDDVLSALKGASDAEAAKIIVLLAAGRASSQQARQVALGADCVLQDPVRTDVLAEYLARYRAERAIASAGRKAPSSSLHFAGAILQPSDRTVRLAGKSVVLTPREFQLLRLLAESRNRVVSYEALYNEILGRRFAGDTANMRVLLGKLAASLDTVGISLRQHVEVISKSGYRYSEARRKPLRLADPSSSFENEAA